MAPAGAWRRSWQHALRLGGAAAFEYHAGVVTSSDTERVSHERVFKQATLDDLASIREYVRGAAASGGLAGVDLEELIVAVNEATSNIIRHGFRGRPANIKVVVACDPEAVEVILRDEGPAFDPDSAPRPDTSLSLAERPFGGMGVQLMRELCDELHYRREPAGGNELRLMKKLSQDDRAS
ncbi:MAG: ATP-binding protein [Chloroflexota bacterium]